MSSDPSDGTSDERSDLAGLMARRLAEYVALWLKSIGLESTFFWYVTAMCGISLIAAISMPDTRLHGHPTEGEGKLMEA